MSRGTTDMQSLAGQSVIWSMVVDTQSIGLFWAWGELHEHKAWALCLEGLDIWLSNLLS